MQLNIQHLNITVALRLAQHQPGLYQIISLLPSCSVAADPVMAQWQLTLLWLSGGLTIVVMIQVVWATDSSRRLDCASQLTHVTQALNTRAQTKREPKFP